MLKYCIHKLIWLVPPLLMLLNQRAGAREVNQFLPLVDMTVNEELRTEESLALFSDLFTDEDRPETKKCLFYKDIAKYYQTSIKVDEYNCNEEAFLLYGPLGNDQYSESSAKKEPLRVASFNLYHLGNKISAYKNYFQLAEIVNQWDVMGAIELKTLAKSSPLHRHNEEVKEKLHELDKQIQSQLSHSPRNRSVSRRISALRRQRLSIANKVILPGYLQLLIRLRKLDPTWSLVMTTEGEGLGTHMELTGIFFRARRVHLAPAAICGGKAACSLKIDDEDQPLVSRRPLVAGLQSGNFQFQFSTMHTKFNKLSQGSDPSSGPDLILQAQKRLKQLIQNSDEDIENLGQLYIGRYAEVAIALNQIKKIKAQSEIPFQPLILAGDFNLYVSGKYGKMWDKMLDILSPDYQVYIESPTSISLSSGLASDYDHFVADKSIESICDIGEYRQKPDQFVFDFTKFADAEYLESILKLYKNTRVADRTNKLKAEYSIAKSFKDVAGKTLAEFKAYLESQDNDRINSKDTITFYGIPYDAFVDIKSVKDESPLFTEVEINELITEMYERVLIPQKRDAFSPFVFLFSDHIPISMSCQTNL